MAVYQESARKRIMKALRGEDTRHVPFTTYSLFSELSTFERGMRELGMGYVCPTRSYDLVYKNAAVREIHYTKEGVSLIRTEYETPCGLLYTEQMPQPEYHTSWTKEHLFKGPDDYKALLWLVRDMKAVPQYGRASKLVSDLGEDFAVRDWILLEPLQNLISSVYMDAQTFAIEWYDHRDEILQLYDAFRELNRSIYPIIAQGPLEFVNYGGNVMPSLIGKENFKEYYVPNYDEAAEALHRAGKLLGTHLDDNNAPIMDEIAATALDYIEAYDPGISPPMPEAFTKLKGKALWINWPSAWHNETAEQAYKLTRELISQVPTGGRLIIAVTENMPPGRERELFPQILKAIRDMGR
jgi:hypothetical protein